MASYLKIKYKLHSPDFIVTEFNMLPLVERYGEEMFGDVPVIVNWKGPLPDASHMAPRFIYIPNSPDAEQNIELILQTRPRVKRIYMVIGDSADERNIVQHFRRVEPRYTDMVSFVWLNKLPYRDMLEAVRHAGEDSAILYYHCFADVEGKRFESAEVLLDLVNVAKAPIYGNAKPYLGKGLSAATCGILKFPDKLRPMR